MTHVGTYRHALQPCSVLQAAAYYAQSKNSEALADALYRLEDFDGLEQLTAALPEGGPLLLHLGERFQSVGLCQQAAAAYIKVLSQAASFSWVLVKVLVQAVTFGESRSFLARSLSVCLDRHSLSKRYSRLVMAPTDTAQGRGICCP